MGQIKDMIMVFASLIILVGCSSIPVIVIILTGMPIYLAWIWIITVILCTSGLIVFFRYETIRTIRRLEQREIQWEELKEKFPGE